jgi:hypothetical protein
LHEFTYLSRRRKRHPRNIEQPVKEGVFPRESGTGTTGLQNGTFEQPGHAVQPVKRGVHDPLPFMEVVKLRSDKLLQPTVVPAFRPWAPHYSILAARCMYPSTFSQLISKPYHYALFKVPTDVFRTSIGFRDIMGMGEKPFSDAARRCNWKSTCTPGEGQDATWLMQRLPLKPPLKDRWEFIHWFSQGTRKRNVTEGHAQGLHLVRSPIRTPRTGGSYPPPEHPAPMLLRNTTGHETAPNCLPESSLGIDFTPWGLFLDGKTNGRTSITRL